MISLSCVMFSTVGHTCWLLGKLCTPHNPTTTTEGTTTVSYNISAHTMVSSTCWCTVILLCFLLHKLLQLFIYFTFGISYGYINPLTLTVHNLVYKSSHVGNLSIEVGSIRLALSLFTRSKYYVELSISDVVFNLSGLTETTANTKEISSDKDGNTKRGYSESLCSDLKFIESLSHQVYDPKAPVVIFPENKKLKRLIKFCIRIMPHLSFIIRSSKVMMNSELSIRCAKIIGKTDISRATEKTSFLKKSNDSRHTWASSLQFHNCALFNNRTNQIMSSFFSVCESSVTFQLDVDTGIASSLQPVLRVLEMDISIIYILKLIKSINPTFQINNKKSNQDSQDIKLAKIPKYKLYIYGFVFRLLKNTSISLQNLTISDIPLTTADKLNNFLNNITLHSADDEVFLDDVIFLSAKVASASLDVSPVNPNQVGYTLKFVEGSLPLQWIYTFTNLKLTLDYSKIKSYTGKTKDFDVVFIPNLLFTMESTMMINILRVVFNNYMQDSFARKQTITTIQMTVANPSMDISAEQLSILMKTFKEKDDECLRLPTEEEELDDATREEYQNRKIDYKNIFLNTSPKFQIKLFLEKPLIIVKSENEVAENRDIHLSTFQPSMIGLQLDITTVQNIMKFAFRCDVPDTAMIYQRNNLNKSATTYISIKDVHLKIAFQLFNFSNLSTSFSVGGLAINLTNLEVINGLSIFLNSLKKFIYRNKPTIDHQHHQKQSIFSVHKFFKDLPSWFSKLNLTFNDINIAIGSKSLFLFPDDLLNEANEYNNFLDDKVYAPSSLNCKIGKVEWHMRNKRTGSDSEDNTSTSYSENSKTPDDYYWLVSSKIVNTQIITKAIHPDFEIAMNDRILKIPQLDTTFYCLKKGLFELSTVINTIDVSHSVSSHFTLFSSFYLIKNAITHHNFTKSDDIPVAEKSNTEPTTVKKTPLLNIINFKWYLKEAQLKMIMPQNFNLRIDLFDLKGFAGNGNIIMEKKLTRVFVKKNPEVDYLNRFIVLDNMKIVCQLPNEKHKLMKISISDNNIKFSVPSNFIVHSFFDAIILTIKLTKKFVKSIKTGPTTGLDKVTSTGILKLPKIKIRSETMAITIDDDPFETELGMIYQLGLLEQKSRLEKQKYFNQYIESIRKDAIDTLDTDEKLTQLNEILDTLMVNPVSFDQHIEDLQLSSIINECSRKLHKLRANISKSWMVLVNEYKFKRKSIVSANTNFLSENIVSSITPSLPFNSKIIDFNDFPPLMSLLFNDFIFSIKPPTFERDGDVHRFVYRVGKGVSTDTVWDKIIPLDMNIRACEVRVHLRDFPLPFVYIPNYKSSQRWSDSFNFKSKLVLAEPMPTSDKQYWYIHIPMYDDIVEGGSSDPYYSWQAPKTITSVKSYYEMDCDINSDNSTMVTWSTSYQAVLRQLSICFDTFSKPTHDPSPKLGVWDKLRNILHGYIKFNWINESAEVCLNILNTQDPYNILGYNSGFSLIFKDDIKWLINDPERVLERDYFIFKSKRILFGIPNYLSQPLPCWCTRKLIFLPSDAEEFFVTSLYGYYLKDELYLDNNALSDNMLAIAADSRFKTHNIFLNGNVELKITMIFERKLEDGSKTTEFRSHFDNILTSSHLVKDKTGFDSYRGFRSDFIHMGLALSAKNSSYNILRLTPRSIFHFRKWFKQFSGDIGLPIRNGSLWTAKNESVKFGGHLMTFKYMFDVGQLYIYHGYRIDLIKPDNHTLIGLKAKIASFKCDLHQRKEKKVKHVEFFDQNYDIMKMTFYMGKIDLSEIDLRVIGLNFAEARDDEKPLHKFEIFDDDQEWIDVDDYEEIDVPPLKYSDINGQIHPLLYASHFCYWMDKKYSENEFGNEESHLCHIVPEEFPMSGFHHIFDTDKLKFKWYPHVRNLIFEYMAGLEFRNAYLYSTSYSAINAINKKLDELADATPSTSQPNTKSRMLGFNITSETEFEEAMRNVADYFKSTIAVDHMLLRFDDVQIQLMADPEQEQLILFRVKHNEIEIVNLMDEDWYRYVNSANIAKRFGTIFQNADLLIMSKKDYNELGKQNSHYGSKSTWPAFLDGDEPEEFIKSRTLLSDVLFYTIIEKTSNSYAGGKRRNKLYVNIPKFETKIDSESYLTFLDTVQHLLIYASPQQKQFAEMAEALALATGDMDKRLLLNNLKNSSHEISELMLIYQSLIPMRCVTEGETFIDTVIRQKCSKLFSNALILSKLALMSCDPISGKEDDNCFMEWVISAPNINIELVDNQHSFLNFIMKDCSFSRLEMLDKATVNEISIKTIKILNTDYNILYPELLVPYEPDSCFSGKYPRLENMVKFNWELGEKVGGMHNIKNVEISCHPMKISMEDTTGVKLMHFLFPKEIDYKEGKSDSSSEDDYYEDDYNDESSYEHVSDDEKIGVKHLPVNTTSRVNSKTIPKISIDMIEEKDEDANDSRDMSLENSITSEFLNITDEEDIEKTSIVSNGSTHTQKGSQVSKEVSAKNSVVSTYSKKLNKKIVSGKILNTASAVDNLTKMGIRNRDTEMEGDVKPLSISEMSERAKMFFAIRKFVFNDFLLNVTFSGKGTLRLINVNNLTLVVPSFGVRKKIWTSVDMVNAVKKHIIKTLLKQTGRLIRNKLFVHKRKKRVNKLKRMFTK